jgi:hypothetical protein
VRLNRSNALFDLAGGDVDDHEAVITVHRLMYCFELERVTIADPAGRRLGQTEAS